MPDSAAVMDRRLWPVHELLIQFRHRAFADCSGCGSSDAVYCLMIQVINIGPVFSRGQVAINIVELIIFADSQ